MTLTIRPERPADYAAIADINVLAFEQRLDEALIVALSRQRPSFDPMLSLVAERENRVVGHVLFTPVQMRLLSQTVPAVLLAPIAVHPDHQRQGIGGALIRAGHQRAHEQGKQLSLLLGHPDYYPRFGYRTGVFGSASLTVEVAALPDVSLITRSPQADDLPALMQLWQRAEGAVDFAFPPDDTLLDWHSPHPAMQTLVYLRDSTVIGYVKYHPDQPESPRVFLAQDDTAARQIAGHYGRSVQQSTLTLPLHPASAGATAFDATASAESWGAGMAYWLGTDNDERESENLLATYIEQRNAGQRPAGRPLWSSAFDLA